jgi:uncharacterized protein (AIM24 family)
LKQKWVMAPTQAGLTDKLLSAGSRILTGESLFMTHFTNRETEKLKLVSHLAGTIIPVDLATCGQ